MTKKQSAFEKAHENFKCLKSYKIKTWHDLSLMETIDLWIFFGDNEDLFPENFIDIMNEFFDKKQEYDYDEYFM